jgi:hypothetical protein
MQEELNWPGGVMQWAMHSRNHERLWFYDTGSIGGQSVRDLGT